MPKRILVLPIAAAVIAGLCAYKLTRSYDGASGPSAETKRPAPLFELYRSRRPLKRVRLASYLGRHRVIVVFFDAGLGAEKDPRLQRLYRDAERIEEAGIKVFAISGALPQENRRVIARVEAEGGRIPFPLLSDPPPTESASREAGYRVHRAWNRYEARTGRPLPGLFLVDRTGRVAWGPEGPIPVPPSSPAVERFLEGEAP